MPWASVVGQTRLSASGHSEKTRILADFMGTSIGDLSRPAWRNPTRLRHCLIFGYRHPESYEVEALVPQRCKVALSVRNLRDSNRQYYP